MRPPSSPDERILLLEQLAEQQGELINDHEKRIRWVERLVTYGCGVLGLGSAAFTLLDRFGRH